MNEDENTPQESEVDIEVEVDPLIDEPSHRSLAEAMRTAALEINTAARDRINSKEAFDSEGVHEIRVATKRLRGLWQLVRPVTEPQIARVADQRLREVAHTIAGARDNEILSELLIDLRDAEEPLYQGTFNRAATVLPEEPDLEGAAQELRTFMLGVFDEDREDWLSLVLPDNEALIEHGLGRAYRKAVRRATTAGRTDNHTDNHRWRRWVKYLRYQLEALDDSPSESLAARIEALTVVGRLLGKRNDLAVLREQLQQGGEGDPFGAVFRAIELRDMALKRRMEEYLLFDLSPEEFAEAVDSELFDG